MVNGRMRMPTPAVRPLRIDAGERTIIAVPNDVDRAAQRDPERRSIPKPHSLARCGVESQERADIRPTGQELPATVHTSSR
jgi:hypothetical protein